MIEQSDTVAYKFRFAIAATLLLVTIILISLIITPTTTESSNSGTTATPQDTAVLNTAYISDNPNVVSSGLSTMMSGAGKSTEALGDIANNAGYTAHRNFLTIGTVASKVNDTIHNTVRNGAIFITHATVDSFLYLVNVPGNIFGFISDKTVVSSLIKPQDDTQTPMIGTIPNVAMIASAPLPVLLKEPELPHPEEHDDSSASWPIKGQITTHFGVPHWPFQPTHSGIDISDGNAPGITPVKPFRPGKVVETVASYSGLGHYVVVDHGNGLTSVYAHLSTITVQVGQVVSKTTTLGTEGSTGASTGTHLHFEIRINGVPVDPRQYVQGLPQ